ncbi:hypothetical protein V1478_001127 [Vespula squamosa]|uniref:Uncharacterized protein n=1 Tax=Vespula squamosa TaxID=30214 RepID=A0ABD2C7G7_VESSQ
MIYVSLVLRNSKEEEEEEEEEKIRRNRRKRRLEKLVEGGECGLGFVRPKNATRAKHPFFFGSRPHIQRSYFPTWFFSSLMPLPKSPTYDTRIRKLFEHGIFEEEEEEEEEEIQEERERERENFTRAKEQRQIFLRISLRLRRAELPHIL